MPHDEGAPYYYPRWAHIGEVAVPAALAVAVALQYHALVPPRWPALVAGIAALPWLLEPVGARLPRLLSAAIVLGAVLALVVQPVRVDMAPFFLVFLTAYTALVGARWEGLAVMAASIAVIVGVELAGVYSDSFIWVLAIVLGWAWGRAIGVCGELIQQLRAAQAGLAERAATEERQRIAREIHDVVAHSLAVTMLHLTGARLALRRDPQDAEAALLRAEQLGRQSLTEIRRTVGLLGPVGTGTAPAMPTAVDIPQLVWEFQSAGLDVAFELTGDPGGLTPATGLGLYRIAQESLTNAAKHALGAPASIWLHVGDHAVHLRVCNRVPATGPRPTADGGIGVRGMRERAEQLGGTLRAGPDDDGWSVDVELPRVLEPA